MKGSQRQNMSRQAAEPNAEIRQPQPEDDQAAGDKPVWYKKFFSSLEDEEEEEYRKWEKGRLQSISSQIVEWFPDVMFFHTCFIGMCVIRAPTDFAVACALFALLMRIVVVFGFYCNKKGIWIGAAGVEVLTNVFLIFIAMTHNQFAGIDEV